MWSEEIRGKEWDEYLTNFPEGEDILFALKFWMDYLGDGEKHPAIRIRTFKYAMRVLHFMSGGDTQQLGFYWKNRIRDFGLKHDPSTNEFEIVNKHLWRHAVSILRQSDIWHNGVSRLPWRYFIKRIESGCNHNDPIDMDELPERPLRKKLKERAFSYSPRPERPYVPEARGAFQPPVEYAPVRNYVFKLTEEM